MKQYPKSSSTIPCHLLDHCLQSNIVTNQVLVASEYKKWYLGQDFRHNSDRGILTKFPECGVERAAAFRPCFRMGTGMQGIHNVFALPSKVSPLV